MKSNLLKIIEKELFGEETVSSTDMITLENTVEDTSLKIGISGNSYQETKSTANGDEYDSPSLDNPSEIKCCGDSGSVNLKACNKNLFNTELAQTTSQIQVLDNKNGVIEMRGISSYWNCVKINTYFPVGQKFYFSCDYEIADNGNASIQILDEDGTNKTINYTVSNNKITFEFIGTGKMTLQYRCNGATNTGYIKYSNIMISTEKNSDFIKCQSQSISIPVQRQMLEDDYLDFDNEEEVHTKIKITLNGSELQWQKSSLEVDGYSGFYLEQFLSGVSLNNQIHKCENLKIGNYPNDWRELVTEEFIKNNLTTLNIRIKTERLESDTVESFKKYLSDNNIIFYYNAVTPVCLPFTDTQKQALKELSKAVSYDNITHIYSTDETSANITATAKTSKIKKLETLSELAGSEV